MKRFAFALAALAVGTLAFAEDAPAAKIGGYLNAGLYIYNSDGTTTFKSYADDYDAEGYQGVLSATLDATTYGYSLAVELAQSGAAVDTAYAWVSPFTGFKLYAGTGSDALEELDDNDAKLFKNADGLSGVFSASGFTLGANISAPVAAAEVAQYSFGAGYSAESLFDAVFTAQTSATEKKLDAYSISASLSAIPSLSLMGGYNVTANATDAAPFFDVTASYTINDAWSAGVLVYDYLKNNVDGAYGNTSDLGDSIYYVPSVTYAAAKDLSFTGSFYGDTADEPNYAGRLAASYTGITGTTLSAYVEYNTNAAHMADDAKPLTVVNLQFLTSF